MDPDRPGQVIPAVALRRGRLVRADAAGTVDGWGAVGGEPCVVYIKVAGTIEYLGENGEVIESANAQTQRAVYLAWCREHGVPPDAQILG